MSTTVNGHRPAATLPPHNLEAEKSVLGAVLLDERHLYALVADEQLRPEHFYREQHGLVFAAMLKLHDRASRIDQLTVAEALRQDGQLEPVGGEGAIDELAGWVPAAGHARDYGRIVRDNALKRALLRATYEIQAQIGGRRGGGEELIEEAERLIFALRRDDVLSKQRLLELAVTEELDRLEQAAKDDREIPGLATGIRELDRLLGGLQDGRLYVVAARPAMGKSLLSLQFARHAAMHERQRVLFASLEMSDSETAQRHLAAESGVDPEPPAPRTRQARRLAARCMKAGAKASGVPLHLLDDGDLSLFHAARAGPPDRRPPRQLRLIVVDYLQLMRAEQPSGSRVEDVPSSAADSSASPANEMPGVAVAQLSRAVEQRPDKRPLLSDLRETGQIEADADCVLMLYRDDYYDPDSERPGEMDIIVRKNRQGRLGQITTRIDSRLRYLPVAP